MTAGKLLAGQAAGLVVAGLGAAAVLALRSQHRIIGQLDESLDAQNRLWLLVRDVQTHQKGQTVAITALLERERNELEERRARR